MSSSRSSWSVIGEPSSWRAPSSIASTSSPSSASPRRSSISSNSIASASCCSARNLAMGPVRWSTRPARLSGAGREAEPLSPKASISRMRSRSRSNRSPGCSPNTALRMISRVRRLGAGVKVDGSVPRPAGHVALAYLGHQVGQPLHPFAVEGGQHQLALLHVGAAVEEDHRVGAHHRLQRARAATGMEHVGRRREHLLHVVGIGEHHERRRLRQPDREALAVALPAALHERQRARPEPDPLHRGGIGRSWRKVCARHDSPLIDASAGSLPTGAPSQCDVAHRGGQAVRPARACPSPPAPGRRPAPRR